MSLADRLNTHLLNTRIRWATQAQSRTSSIVARASPRLKRIVCNLDSLYSTGISQLLASAPNLPDLKLRLASNGIQVHMNSDNRHQLSRDSNASRSLAVSIRRALRTHISDRVYTTRRVALTQRLANRAESKPPNAKNWHAWPLFAFTDWTANRSSQPLAYLQVPNRSPRVNLGLHIKQRLRVGDPFRGSEHCPAPSCTECPENHTHFITCPHRAFLARQLLKRLHSLATAATKDDSAIIKLYLNPLAPTDAILQDQTSAPINTPLFLLLWL